MPDRLARALHQLESLLVDQRHPGVFGSHPGLQPGLERPVILAQLSEVRVDAPEEVVTFFSWHNGYVRPESATDWSGAWITPVFTPLSLAQAIDFFVRYQDIREAEADSGMRKGSDWFPVAEGGGISLIINCGEDSAERGSVALSDAHDFPPPVRADSLADVVERWVMYLETGQWRWTPAKWIENRDAAEVEAHPWSV